MAETSSLLNCDTPLRGIEGSNPSLSAFINFFMVIVQRKDGDSIDKILKSYKKKVEKIETVKILRSKMFFTKKSRAHADEKKLAVYRQRLRSKDRDE